MAWKPEVKVVGENAWHQNALVFETEEEALASASNLACRWFAVKHFRAVEVDKPVNYRWDEEFGNVGLNEDLFQN